MPSTPLRLRQSTHVKSAEYDSSSGELHVTYHDGGTYTYHGVSEDVAMGLQSAESVGKYMHGEVRGQFRHTRRHR